MSVGGWLVREQVGLNIDRSGAGTPVVFQHGLCGDRRQTTEAFPERSSLARFTLECRGHGLSKAGDPSRFSIATFTDDLAAALEQERIGPAVVGGISMGAVLALRLAVIRPDLVRALVLARPAWVTEAAPDNMSPNAEAGDLLARLPPREARETFRRGETARRLGEVAPDNLASLDGFFDRPDPVVTSELLRRISRDGPGISATDLRAIAVPTLVIGHQRDAIHPIGVAMELARSIPSARFTEITPKADDRSRYLCEFRAALDAFLMDTA